MKWFSVTLIITFFAATVVFWQTPADRAPAIKQRTERVAPVDRAEWTPTWEAVARVSPEDFHKLGLDGLTRAQSLEVMRWLSESRATKAVAVVSSPNWEKWATLGTWAAVLAELIVAAVIYWELRASRTVTAFETIYRESTREGRRRLYDAFLAGETQTLVARQEEFLKRILEHKELWDASDWQVTQFGWLGLILHRRFLPRWCRYGPNGIVNTISHVITPMAVMLLPYVRLRRRHKGSQWGMHFVGLAATCIPFTYKNGIKLFRDELAQGPVVDLGRADLELAHKQLNDLMI